MNPWSLEYWNSGEYQAVREKLDDERRKGYRINPDRKELFRALRLTPEDEVRVCIVGQDPYPAHHLATGVAFSIPAGVPVKEFPPTLRVFLAEYCDDLGYEMPSHGNLEEWCSRGVLLWNAIPSCREGHTQSHDWFQREWDSLTAEILTRLSQKGIVFALLGSIAKRYVDFIDQGKSEVILTSHPSPRGNSNSRAPFTGSRLFTTINAKLMKLGLEPINWRLNATPGTKELPRTSLDGDTILPNITGVDLGGHPRGPMPNLYEGSFEI